MSGPLPERRAIEIAAAHPAFEGHFPGRPLLPAVVLLAEVLAALASASSRGMEQWTIASAKFLMPVVPGTPLTLAHDSATAPSVRFEVRSPQGVVASGVAAARADPAS